MIENLHIDKDEDRALIEKLVRNVFDSHRGGFAGFALVVWAPDGASTADMGMKSIDQGAQIPSMLIPDFVRNRLLGMKIEEWAVDTIKGRT